MSQIKAAVIELEEIKTQIKINNAQNMSRNKPLKERSAVLENMIQKYLEEHDLPGIKYDGKAIIISKKEKKPLKSGKDRKKSMIELLAGLGLDNAESIYEKLDNVQRKDTIEISSIKLEKIK